MPQLEQILLVSVKWRNVLHVDYNLRICNTSFKNILQIRARRCTDNLAVSAAIFTAASTQRPYMRRPAADLDAQAISEASAIFRLLLGQALPDEAPKQDEWFTADRVYIGSAGERF